MDQTERSQWPALGRREHGRIEKWKDRASNWGRGAKRQLGPEPHPPREEQAGGTPLKDGVTVRSGDGTPEQRHKGSPRARDDIGGTAGGDASTVRSTATTPHVDAFAHRFSTGSVERVFLEVTKKTARENRIKTPQRHRHRASCGHRSVKGVPLSRRARGFSSRISRLGKKGASRFPRRCGLIRTGRWARRAKLGRGTRGETAGSTTVLPWLKRRDVSIPRAASTRRMRRRPRREPTGGWRGTASR